VIRDARRIAVGCFAGGVDIVIDVLLDCEF
jgi:hypothetical protein